MPSLIGVVRQPTIFPPPTAVPLAGSLVQIIRSRPTGVFATLAAAKRLQCRLPLF
jgi:hypothetical protein